MHEVAITFLLYYLLLQLTMNVVFMDKCDKETKTVSTRNQASDQILISFSLELLIFLSEDVRFYQELWISKVLASIEIMIFCSLLPLLQTYGSR